MPKISKDIRRRARIQLSRLFLWDYCQTMFPEHYKPTRLYLQRLCNDMQQFLESDDQVMIVNAPPRHYKSFTMTALVEWVFGRNPVWKVMVGSYNEILSETFSKAVKNVISTEKFDDDKIVYSDIFPDIRIKRGDGANNRWSLEGQHANYLATSPGGTATGFGCNLFVIDDLVKSAWEANNANLLESKWLWLTDTILSRLEEGGKILIMMTRWHSKDPAGRALEHFRELGWSVRHVCLKALQDDGTMLCDEVLSYKSYMDKTSSMSPEIASANYQQEPMDIKGRLYTSLKTYDTLPVDSEGNSLFEGVYSQADTADEGDDWLCNIIYGVYLKEAYILDVYYTKDGMEVTEPETARRLKEYNVNLARVESNNGGRGFARALARISSDELKNYTTTVKWYTETKNKIARILTGATWVMEHIYFPSNWRHKWPEFYESMTTYQREGKNAHDDAEDCVTAISEKFGKEQIGVVSLRGR